MTEGVEFFLNILPGITLVIFILSLIVLIGMIFNIRKLLREDGIKKALVTIILLIIIIVLSFKQLLSY